MAYCRWSSDDFRCDIYCYEHVAGGFTIHVAGNRVLGDIPRQMPIEKVDFSVPEGPALWAASHRAQMAFLATAEREDITLPFAGETIQVDTLAEMKAKLLELRELGYRMPDYVFEDIDLELNQGGQ